MPPVEVRLLGPPEVRVDGSPARFKARKALALLALLALEPRPHPRGRIAGMLWPDSEPEVARAALRNAVVHLKGAFEGAADRVRAERDTVELRLSNDDRLDWRELRDGRPDAWRGELLEGLDFDGTDFGAWLNEQRAAARDLADRAFDLATREPHHDGAADLAARWIALDRLSETAWRRLILARLAEGRTGAAREAFEACRRTLREELGVEPAPETLALAGRLREAPPALAPSPTPEATDLRVESRLVGRTSEFARLVDVHRRAARTAQAALLSGEPGIGKSRLAAELLAWARERGAVVLRGRAFEAGGAAFGPLVDVLRPVADEVRARLDEPHRSAVARLLENAAPPPGPPLSPDPEAQARTFAALAEAFLALARDRAEATVVLLDDAQWADSATLAALRQLAARLATEHAPLALLFTARAEHLALGTPLAAFLAPLRRDLPLTHVELGPLDAADVRRFLDGFTRALPEGDAERLSAWLYATTLGHPLYAAETLRDLLERGALRATPEGVRLDEARLPERVEGVRAAIGERLARLSPAALAVAQGAAILGQTADFDGLRDVAGLDEDSVLTGYEELLRAGLLTEGPTGASVLSHDRVRETLRDALSAPRRRLLHRRALDALEARAAPPAILGHHALEAGRTDDAARHFERAGQAALALGAHEEARALLERALAVIPPLPERWEARVRIMEHLRDALYGLDPTLERTVARLEAAIEAAEAGGSLAEATGHRRTLALVYRVLGRYDEGRRTAVRATEGARALGDGRGEAVGFMQQGVLAQSNLDLDAAETAYAASVERATRLDDAELLLRARFRAATVAAERGALDEADALLRAILAEAQAFPDDEGTIYRGAVPRSFVLWELFLVARSRGAYGEAAGWLERLTAADLARGRTVARDVRLYQLGTLALLRGDARAALAHFGEAREGYEKRFRPVPGLAAATAYACAVAGRGEDARRALAEAAELVRHEGHRDDAAVALAWLGDACLELGDVPGAAGWFTRALSIGTRASGLAGLRGLGEVRALQGRHEDAARLLGVVLAAPFAGVYAHDRARAVLENLRAHHPTSALDAAFEEGRRTPLKDAVREETGAPTTDPA